MVASLPWRPLPPTSCGHHFQRRRIRNHFASRVFSDSSEARAWTQTQASPGPRWIQVEAPNAEAAKVAAAVQFDLDEIQRNRIMVQELG